MANKKNTKKANVKEKTIETQEQFDEARKILTIYDNNKDYGDKTPEVVEIEVVEEPIIETGTVSAIEVEEPKVEKKDTAEYEIILARPTYYIINRNGQNVTIKEINNYKKGDKVTL